MSAEAKSGVFWNARHGFVCVAALVLASLALNQGYRLAYENSVVLADWVNANLQLAELGFFFIRGFVWLLIGFLVSQSTSFETFARRSGLDQKPTLGGWLCAWAAIAFGLAVLAIVGQGWGGTR